jgi:DNA-binding NarL/FixJ family response regulator
MLNKRFFLLLSVIAGVILGLTLWDLLREPVMPPLVEIGLDVAEKLILVAAMAGVAWAVMGLTDLREEQAAMANNLARSVAQGEHWRVQRQTEIAALGQAIETQLKAWKLSEAEIDIAGLMLKGASLKEIALARDTSEATIRQQAQSIYRKSGLSGRAELSAYFLESLFETVENEMGKQSGLAVVKG